MHAVVRAGRHLERGVDTRGAGPDQDADARVVAYVHVVRYCAGLAVAVDVQRVGDLERAGEQDDVRAAAGNVENDLLRDSDLLVRLVDRMAQRTGVVRIVADGGYLQYLRRAIVLDRLVGAHVVARADQAQVAVGVEARREEAGQQRVDLGLAGIDRRRGELQVIVAGDRDVGEQRVEVLHVAVRKQVAGDQAAHAVVQVADRRDRVAAVRGDVEVLAATCGLEDVVVQDDVIDVVLDHDAARCAFAGDRGERVERDVGAAVIVEDHAERRLVDGVVERRDRVHVRDGVVAEHQARGVVDVESDDAAIVEFDVLEHDRVGVRADVRGHALVVLDAEKGEVLETQPAEVVAFVVAVDRVADAVVARSLDLALDDRVRRVEHLAVAGAVGAGPAAADVQLLVVVFLVGRHLERLREDVCALADLYVPARAFDGGHRGVECVVELAEVRDAARLAVRGGRAEQQQRQGKARAAARSGRELGRAGHAVHRQPPGVGCLGRRRNASKSASASARAWGIAARRPL